MKPQRPTPKTWQERGLVRRWDKSYWKYSFPPLAANFTYFNKFPPEIRNIIWKEAFPGSRNTILYSEEQDSSDKPANEEGLVLPNFIIRAKRQTLPITLSICQESRSYTQAIYGPRYGDFLNNKPIYFDPMIDWLSFQDVKAVSMFFSGTSAAPFSDRDTNEHLKAALGYVHTTVRNIAVPMTTHIGQEKLLGSCFNLRNVVLRLRAQKPDGWTKPYWTAGVADYKTEKEIFMGAISAWRELQKKNAHKQGVLLPPTCSWYMDREEFETEFLDAESFTGDEAIEKRRRDAGPWQDSDMSEEEDMLED